MISNNNLQPHNDSRREDLSSGDEFDADDYDLQLHTWNLPSLRSSAKQMKLPRPRSLAWAILLRALPKPSPEDQFLKSLKEHRLNYEETKSNFTTDPRAVLGDDPLSQNDKSVWHQHFCDNELKALILQDVVRTFPDEPYFRESDVQDLMVRVLFVWARTHAAIGYRQGMHEVLAPLMFELYIDRKYAPVSLSETLKEVLREDYFENDSHMLFTALMEGLERFYTTGEVVPSACGRLPISKTVHNPNEVVRYLEKVKAENLQPLDPQLATHLSNCNISLELFGIRWLRLLFGREFPRSEIPNLWSYLFAEGPTLPSIQYLIVAMLISMRNTLLNEDPGVVLSALMRPVGLNVGHVIAFSLHLSHPLIYSRPATPPPMLTTEPLQERKSTSWTLEERGLSGSEGEGDEGVAEGADVARELATLALLRAQLPAAAAALARALPRPHPRIAQPLAQILQLSALLQCRNHALIDVETALEAAEGQPTDIVYKRQMVPVTLARSTSRSSSDLKPPNNVMKKAPKEVQLKVFKQVECASGERDLPCLDPLRLRTE